MVVLLKKCPHCLKEIPARMTACPYCHRNDKGQDVTATGDESASPMDGPLQAEIHQLGNEDPFIRKSASDRISQRGPAVVPHLINLVNEHTHKGVGEAVRLLGRIRDRRALSALSQALKVGNEEVRAIAVWSLSQLRDPQALPDLLTETERNNPTVQAYLGHAFAEVQDVRVRPALLRLAKHSNHEVAFQALWTLGESGDPSLIPFLRRQLSRKDPVVKAAAETALRRLGGPTRRILPVRWIVGVVAGIIILGILLGWIYR
jgi:HEAT repeat protein